MMLIISSSGQQWVEFATVTSPSVPYSTLLHLQRGKLSSLRLQPLVLRHQAVQLKPPTKSHVSRTCSSSTSFDFRRSTNLKYFLLRSTSMTSLQLLLHSSSTIFITILTPGHIK
jgi:hypothetical protein